MINRMFQNTINYIRSLNQKPQNPKAFKNGQTWEVEIEFNTNDKLEGLKSVIIETIRANIVNFKYPENLQSILDFMAILNSHVYNYLRNNKAFLLSHIESSYIINSKGEYEISFRFKKVILWEVKITIV